MKRNSLLLAFVSILVAIVFSGCREPRPAVVVGDLPDVCEACTVLQNFQGEYSYGGCGNTPESTDGELAVWTIYHSPDAVERLVRVFPQCGPTGQAYALAALCRLDQPAFQSLTNAFCKTNDDIRVGSGCMLDAVPRARLLVKCRSAALLLDLILQDLHAGAQ
jgi:hypothetical protein